MGPRPPVRVECQRGRRSQRWAGMGGLISFFAMVLLVLATGLGIEVTQPAPAVAAGQVWPGVGVVTGVAPPCVGNATAAYEAIPVEVSLRQGYPFASEMVHGSSIFRFLVPPGNYVLSSDAMPGSRSITVLAHRTTRVNLIPSCEVSFPSSVYPPAQKPKIGLDQLCPSDSGLVRHPAMTPATAADLLNTMTSDPTLGQELTAFDRSFWPDETTTWQQDTDTWQQAGRPPQSFLYEPVDLSILPAWQPGDLGRLFAHACGSVVRAASVVVLSCGPGMAVGTCDPGLTATVAFLDRRGHWLEWYAASGTQ